MTRLHGASIVYNNIVGNCERAKKKSLVNTMWAYGFSNFVTFAVVAAFFPFIYDSLFFRKSHQNENICTMRINMEKTASKYT